MESVHVKFMCKCLTWATLRPPQVAYFLSWPTLGSAIILTMMPSEDRMRQVRVVSLCNVIPTSCWNPMHPYSEQYL